MMHAHPCCPHTRASSSPTCTFRLHLRFAYPQSHLLVTLGQARKRAFFSRPVLVYTSSARQFERHRSSFFLRHVSSHTFPPRFTQLLRSFALHSIAFHTLRRLCLVRIIGFQPRLFSDAFLHYCAWLPTALEPGFCFSHGAKDSAWETISTEAPQPKDSLGLSAAHTEICSCGEW